MGGGSQSGGTPQIPFADYFTWVFNLDFDEQAAGELGYQFKKIGSFLEGVFEYDVPLGSRFGLNLWARGTWLPGQWNGRLELQRIFVNRGQRYRHLVAVVLYSFSAASSVGLDAESLFGQRQC